MIKKIVEVHAQLLELRKTFLYDKLRAWIFVNFTANRNGIKTHGCSGLKKGIN